MASRKNIPKTLKNDVWDHYIGKQQGMGKCWCCKKEIDSKNFECGHVVSVKNRGPTKLENLRPICSCCNKSMGTENMLIFKHTYYDKSPLDTAKIYLNKIEKIINFIRDIS